MMSQHSGPGSHGQAESGPAHSGAAPASNRGMAQLGASSFDVTQAVGGVRGLIESVAPGLVFVIVYIASRELSWALIASIGLAVIGAIGRLATRGKLSYVFGGLIGVAIGTVWAWRTGQAEDFFVWGLYVNAGGVLITLLSIVVRWPLVGVVTSQLVQIGSQWRTDRAAMRAFGAATALWVALFAVRLAVQVPLYLNASVGWLGTARLAMGVPLWALVLYLTWLLVHPVVQRYKAASQSQAAGPGQPEEDRRSPEQDPESPDIDLRRQGRSQ